MAIIGWILCLAIMGFVSLAYGLAFFNNMGTYNIGGVPNSGAKRFVTLLFGGVLVVLWISLFKAAPFTITVGG